MSDALYRIDFLLEVMPINFILYLLAYCITGFNSSVFPELLIIIKRSFLEILPKSP